MGIGIRMKKLGATVQAAAETPPVVTGPVRWWGWLDESDQPATHLVNVFENAWSYPYMTPDDIKQWVAVADSTAVVNWVVEFTPTVWVSTPPVVEWEGDMITLTRPQDLPDTPEVLFTPGFVTLPDPLSVAYPYGPYDWWPTNYYIPGFPDVLLPRIIGAGNTLSITHYCLGCSGVLVAKAYTGATLMGSVTLELRFVAYP